MKTSLPDGAGPKQLERPLRTYEVAEHRRFHCLYYRECLTLAAEQCWKSFSCKSCFMLRAAGTFHRRTKMIDPNKAYIVDTSRSFGNTKNIPKELAEMHKALVDICTEARSICERGDKLRRDYILYNETFKTLLTMCDKCNQIVLTALQAADMLQMLQRSNNEPT